MTERRTAEEPRRKDDRHVCPVHDLIQNDTADHRDMVCKKIAAKADGTEVRGLARLIVLLVSICCVVIAGQAIWLRSDSEKLDKKIDDGFTTIHRRITDTTRSIDEHAKIRIDGDTAQMRQLADIQGQLGVMSWRLTQIEDANKKTDKGGQK